MKRKLYFILLLIFIISCKKDEPSYTYKNSEIITKYSITLSNNEITSYKKYLNDNLTENVTFSNPDSVMEVTTINIPDHYTKIEKYILNANGLADSCIISNYRLTDTTITVDYYQYEGDYLIKHQINTGEYYYTYLINNQNITSASINGPSFQCSDNYTMNNNFNKIDLLKLRNGKTGKWSKNLIQQVAWFSGCPSGPSMSVAHSDYYYTIGNNNYVTNMTEIFTPSYHMEANQRVIRTAKLTFFEYTFR